MYLLIKHLLSTAWVPARPEGPEHSDCGVQYTEAGQTGSGPGIVRWRPQAGSIPARPPLSLPGPCTGLARGQWEAVGTGASSPSLGKLQGRRLPEGPSQGGSPGAHLPLTPLLVTPGRTLGPLEGLPSLTHEVRSISLSRWSAGETALLGEGLPSAGPVGNATAPSWPPGTGPGGRLPVEPWALKKRPPRPLQTAWHRPVVPCHLLPGISPGESSPRPPTPRLLLTPSWESLVVFVHPWTGRWRPLPEHAAP